MLKNLLTQCSGGMSLGLNHPNMRCASQTLYVPSYSMFSLEKDFMHFQIPYSGLQVLHDNQIAIAGTATE